MHQHNDRTFYDVSGNVLRTDSRVLIFPTDYLGLEPLSRVVPKFREARLVDCDGRLFCGQPYYLPVIHMMP